MARGDQNNIRDVCRLRRRGQIPVVFHAASSAFPQWKEYSEITGLGGWGGRMSGLALRSLQKWKRVRDDYPARQGILRETHPFQS